MTVLRCMTVWEWLMLCTGIGAYLFAWQHGRSHGFYVTCGVIDAYLLGMLNGRRLAQAESSMGTKQAPGNEERNRDDAPPV